MEFRETLLAAQRNQQQKSSGNSYYKARFEPPKKLEQKPKDKLSANIQKFLAKQEEEEKQKQLEVNRKRDELLAMRDPKAMRKIQKSLKVFRSANKAVIADAIDRDNTAVTRAGPEQPDQDDYGYESQEAAAIYEKMMQKYSKIPEVPKFPAANTSVKKDLNGTRERVRQALQHEDDPVPHKRQRRKECSTQDRDSSPPSKYEPEKKKDDHKPEKPKIRKPVPPPMDFNQLLKLAEKKKSEPIEVNVKKQTPTETESTERLMTKKQKKEYEEEMARRQRRQERIDAEKSGKKKEIHKDEKIDEKDKKLKLAGFGRIPSLSDRNKDRNNSPKINDKEREKDRNAIDREKVEKLQKEKEKANFEKDKLDRLKAEKEKIERDIERLNKDRERLEKTRSMLESKSSKLNEKPKSYSKEEISSKKSIDLKSQNTYRIDKNSNEKRSIAPNKMGPTKQIHQNGHSSQGKPVPKLSKEQILKDRLLVKQKTSTDDRSPKLNGHSKAENGRNIPDNKKMDDRRPAGGSAGPSKVAVQNTFDFDKHVSSLKNGSRQFPPGDVKRKPRPDDVRKKNRRMVPSDSEYDSEMDDFIDDGEEDMDYSTHIKEIFGYDKSKYRNMDDDDDPTMESSFSRQQREEYISKKIGIMEDLEDMRLEAMQKKKSKKGRRISDD